MTTVVSGGDREENDSFFDTREEISSASDTASDDLSDEPVSTPTSSSSRSFELLPGSEVVSGNVRYEIWVSTPTSVNERRNKFFKWMNSTSPDSPVFSSPLAHPSADEISRDSVEFKSLSRLSSAVLRHRPSSDLDPFAALCPSQASVSSHCSNPSDHSTDGVLFEDGLAHKIRNLDTGKEFVVDESATAEAEHHDGVLVMLREVGSNRSFTIDEFERFHGIASPSEQRLRHEIMKTSLSFRPVRKKKKGFLRKLASAMCIVDKQQLDQHSILDPLDFAGPSSGAEPPRIKVHSCRKRSKELSALYVEQDIQAHDGPILTMRFSHDGRYLASAGEDYALRVWQVIEWPRRDDADMVKSDPSCTYFKMDDSCDLSPLDAAASSDKEKMPKSSIATKTDSVCVIFPTKTFRISETPLHVFYGHSGNILDLSWSSNKHLLTASEDQTVRLWQIGRNECLKIFPHNDYVTCVQFNPVNDDYFISGSIDGKVRIWTIDGYQVDNWIGIREMVTAICYSSDGQKIVVGSMTGNCRFYDASDNSLKLDAQTCFQSKKKSPIKANRIIGLQSSPNDPGKFLVTSADLKIRVLDGSGVVICRYRGSWKTGNQITASYTSDGRHVISASDDSNVYIWSNSSLSGQVNSQTTYISSCERFSCNASVAIPWSGMKSETLSPNEQVSKDNMENSEYVCDWSQDASHDNLISLSSPTSFSLSRVMFLEATPRGSATWPEERFSMSSSMSRASSMGKSHQKLLKNSFQNSLTSHAWGLVIVTGGWDGHIRSFHNYGLPV